MSKLHQWVNTGLLAACAIALGVLLIRGTRTTGVQCLEPQEAAQQFFKINKPGFCIAVAPISLDSD